jgi:hypothetical protein
MWLEVSIELQLPHLHRSEWYRVGKKNRDRQLGHLARYVNTHHPEGRERQTMHINE